MTKKELKNKTLLGEALANRSVSKLPSNFTHRMMQQVYKEEAKIRAKEHKREVWIPIVASLCLLVGMLVTLFFIYKDQNLISTLGSYFKSSVLGFYLYISLLVVLLLGMDYLLTRYFKKKEV